MDVERTTAPDVEPPPVKPLFPSVPVGKPSQVEAAAAASRSLDQQKNDVLNWTRASFAKEKEQAHCGPRWTVESWLRESVARIIAKALVEPLAQEEERENMELPFVRALARMGSRDLVCDMLSKGKIVDALAAKVMELADELHVAPAATARELNSKFSVDPEVKFAFIYGRTTEFFSGLEELIGAPDPNVLYAMKHEHCNADDSNIRWTTTNYGVTTTPRIEWHFVVTPETPLDHGEWPKETINAEHPREAKPLEDFRRKFDDLNEKLGQKGEPTVRDEEWIGVRLYTGPMFEKFNTVLRGGLLTGDTAHFGQQFLDLCHGNRYVTTIHVINSALIKLSKLEIAAKLYRGMKGGRLPECFWEGGEEKVRGGIERGFLSTSKNKEVAQQYTRDGAAQTIFEIQTGLIDRGADLSQFSQYPHEEEICFPPLTCLEVLQDRAEGSCLVLEMRLNVNLTSDTIERVITRRHRIVQNMCSHMHLETIRYLETRFWKEVVTNEDQVTLIQKRARKLAKEKLKSIHAKPPESFNNDVVLLSAVKRALAVSDSIKWMKSTVLLDVADDLETHPPEGRRVEASQAAASAIGRAKELKQAHGVTTVTLTNADVNTLELTRGSSTGLVMERLKLEDIGGVLHLQEEHPQLPDVGKGFELAQVNGRRGSVSALARAIVSSVGGAKLEFLKQRDSDGLKEEVIKILKGGEKDPGVAVGRLLALNPDTHSLDLRGPFGKTTPEQDAQKLPSEAGEAIMKAMEMNWTLHTLLLCNNAMGAAMAKLMSPCLRNNYTLRTLNMGNNQLGPEGGTGIAEMLRVTVTIDTLRVRENNLGPVGGKAVAEGLKVNKSLRTLYIERNGLGEEGGRAFAESLRQNHTLQGLHIDGNQLGPEGGTAIARALEHNTGLMTLWMEKNAIGEVAGTILAETLSKNKTLKAIGLSNNNVGPDGSVAIAKSLENNTDLITLVFSDNNIGQRGSIAIAEALEKNTDLSTLWLEGNKFGDEGGQAFAKSLKVNTSLQNLRLQNIGMGPKAARSIAEALMTHKGHDLGLWRLSVDRNAIGFEGVEALARAIACDACNLRILDMKHCDLDLEGARKIAQSLEKTRLSELAIQENKLGDEGGAVLAKALETNSSLLTLKMHDNLLGPKSAQTLASALQKNATLKKLQLNGEFGDDGKAVIEEAWRRAGRSGGLEWQKMKTK